MIARQKVQSVIPAAIAKRYGQGWTIEDLAGQGYGVGYYLFESWAWAALWRQIKQS